MWSELIGEITGIETIAQGKGIRERARLVKIYGRGRWRKRKGVGTIKLSPRQVVKAELHWYEAHGIGRRELKVKRIL
jgi:hypothetical protein